MKSKYFNCNLLFALCLVFLLSQQSYAFETRDDAEKAIANYTQILENNPNNAPVLIQRGDVYFQLFEFDV